MADVDPALGQEILDVAQRQRVLHVHQHRQTDYLGGLLSRMERGGHIAVAPDTRDRRSRIVTMTDAGHHVWRDLALPDEILADFSINDVAHMLHYLLNILENMQRLDASTPSDPIEAAEDAAV